MGFIDPEQAIIQRLNDKLAEHNRRARIYTAADLATIEERSQVAPALHVLFDEYAPTQELNKGIVQQVEQQWTVVVAVRNAAGQITGEGVRKEAAPLIDVVFKALCGWRPAQDFEGLRLGQGPGPAFSEGFGYFPLTFRVRTVVRGEP